MVVNSSEKTSLLGPTYSKTKIPAAVPHSKPSTSTGSSAVLDSTSAEAAVQTTESGLSPEMDVGGGGGGKEFKSGARAKNATFGGM